MADNVAITPGAGTSVATDDVGGVHYQRIKVAAGGDGTAWDLEGVFGYAAGTAAATVDVPATARLKRVTALASGAGTATVTIGGGATITILANGSFDEQIPGIALGADVVFAGQIASYFVSWVT